MKDGAPGWWGATCAPAAGCWYPQVWGESIDEDLAFTPDVGGQLTWQEAIEVFYVKSLPWLFLNQSNPVRFEESREVHAVHFANGTCSSLTLGSTGTDLHRITHENRVVLDGLDWCIPLAWRPGACIARHGVATRRKWEVGGMFGATEWVTAIPLRSSTATAPKQFKLHKGWLELDLPLGSTFLVE